MKQIIATYLFTIFTILAIDVRAQEGHLGVLPLIDGRVCYEQVLEIQPKELDKHMGSVLEWMSQEGLRPTEKQRSVDRFFIKGSGQLQCLWGPNDYSELYKKISFTVELTVKEDRLQYAFNDFMVHDQNSAYHLEIYKMESKRDLKYTESMHVEIDSIVLEYIRTLQLKMNSNSEGVISRE